MQGFLSYIDHNEKIQCMGEDRDQNKKLSLESNDQKPQLSHKILMADHALQRDVPAPVSVPSTSVGATSSSLSAQYGKLCMSFLSGLPNEQDLALNVCTILANEGSHSINLEYAPKLVELLVAQTGVWMNGDTSFKMMYLECWKDLQGRNMHRFWRNTLDLRNSTLIDLLGLDLGEYDPDESLLNLESDLGVLNSEGQRVLRVALILHNLSFEKHNVPVLIRSTTFIRFLLLSIHTSWANLRQTAYDTLANLAHEIELHIEKDNCSRVLFQTVIDGVQSPDRFMSIRSMDILSQLCSSEPNEDIPSRLDIEVYRQLVSLLTVEDIMLLFYTLEALYSLSELGKYPCDKIASVHGSIGVLVSLLTLDPTQYGKSAEIRMKVVEILVPSEFGTVREVERPAVTVTPTEVPVPAPVASPVVKNKDITSEVFANNWLKSNYEIYPGQSISRNEIYADYVGFCTKSGRKGVVNANIFANCVKNSFPLCELKKVQSGSGIITFHHDGIRKRKLHTAPCTPTAIKPVSVTGNTGLITPTRIAPAPSPKPIQSPILKAQLSAPAPKTDAKIVSAPAKQPVYAPRPPTPISPAPAVAAATTAGGSSTLIKSLLASKVQQKTMQRPVVPQNVSKMVIFSPGKMTSLTPGGASAVMRCVVPQMGLRAPLQARLVGNKGCIIAANPTQIIQPASVLTASGQSKVFHQQTVIAAAAPGTPNGTAAVGTPPPAAINGVGTDESMDVCNQNPPATVDVVKQIQTLQTNSVQNHVISDASASAKMVLDAAPDAPFPKDKAVNAETDQNFIISHIQGNTVTYRLAGPHELPVSAGNRLFVRSNSAAEGLQIPKEQNGNPKPGCLTLSSTQPLLQPRPTSVTIKTPGAEDPPAGGEVLAKQQVREEICKKSPLLNGLLDKGKTPLTGDILFNALVENGIEASDVGLDLPPSPVQQQQQKLVSPPPTNQIILPTSSLNSVFIPASSLSPTVLPLSSPSILSTYVLSPSPTPSALANAAASANGANVVQIRTGKTTFSGTAEADQKGVVRLHIESPENSNQGSDLSSISDIARTLECASEAISKTNAECNTRAPTSTAASMICATSANALLATTSTSLMVTSAGGTPTAITVTAPGGSLLGASALTSSLARPNQQIIVVTPSLSQPQLQLQSPNIKFCILHTVPVAGDAIDLVGLPQINLSQLNQLQQAPAADGSPVAVANLKRPSPGEASPASAAASAKKPRVDPPPNPEAATVAVDAKPPPETAKLSLADSLKSKLSGAATSIPVLNSEPSSKDIRTHLVSSGGGEGSPATAAPSTSSSLAKNSSKLEYVCEWKTCGLKFPNPGSVFLHASKVHTPPCEGDMVCLWDGCDSMKRKRFSLLTHLQDWHCNERVLQQQAMRRMQIIQQGQTSISPPQKPPPHPGYAPDAAVLAIKRHALQYVNPKELAEEKEVPLTKSIRLTSALILRNLVTHSALARTYTRRFEPELAYLAMSNVESAKAIAQCLSQLSRSKD